MSLKAFHIVFVSLSSLLCFAFGGWNLHRYRTEGGFGALALGVGALAAGMGLIVYGRWFWQKITTRDEERRRRRRNLRKLPIALGAIAAGHLIAPEAWACSSCFGAADGPLIDAARIGVYFLFGFVLVLQLSFASFFVYLWRRSRRFNREAGALDALD